jgi:hypothetical protein
MFVNSLVTSDCYFAEWARHLELVVGGVLEDVPVRGVALLEPLKAVQDLGPMLRFFKYFRRKIQRKNWRF